MIDWDYLESIDYHPNADEATKGWNFHTKNNGQKMIPLAIPNEENDDNV